MDIYEITGFRTGVDKTGVNFLNPSDAFDRLYNCFIYRQVLQSRLGFVQFGNRLADNTRVMGIFENVLPDGSKELLVASQQFLYIYVALTNTFTQIPFTSTLGIVNFGITDPTAYISGTTYLTAAGTKRFVFTSKGMDITLGGGVYYYENLAGPGSGVKVFTNAADNVLYVPPASGNLLRATNVIWFGERINFFVPLIGGTQYNQGILYSGIRDAAGNGDSFNAPGSGLLSADTYELMKGALNLGDVLVLNFQRSSWTLEKTRDVFNPYFVRKIPSVLGTDAGFSAVSWAYEVKSLGKTGCITTDGRQSLRFDDKFPNFTRDEVEQNKFELTYGGFDRATEQFMFAYRSNLSTLSTNTQDSVLIYNYKENTWAQNNQRFSVFGQSDVGLDLVWNDIDGAMNPAWARWDETEEIWNKIGRGASVQKTLAGDNLGFVYEINKDFDDYFVNISAITLATSAVVTVSASAFQVGDRVILANVGGMTQINGLKLFVLAASATSLTLNINSTNFTAYTSGGTVSKIIDFQAEMSPFNPYRSHGRQVYVSHIEFLINTNSAGMNVGIFDNLENDIIKNVRVESPISDAEREWIEIIVDHEANFLKFVLSNESSTRQTIITSIRIHASPGAYTSS